METYEEYIRNLFQVIHSRYPDTRTCRLLSEKTSYPDALSVCINYEHILVRSNGRSIDPQTSARGRVRVGDTSELYFCRIDHPPHDIFQADMIIDYSLSNLGALEVSQLGGIFETYLRKAVYVSPTLYDHVLYHQGNRTLDVLTSFTSSSLQEPRRHHLVNQLSDRFPEYRNVCDKFTARSMRDILLGTKVIVNIHQTDHHHTFEELRVLPALQCGVIVVSEYAALIEAIPYRDMIVWANYEDIVDRVQHVLDHYEMYHSQIFTLGNVQLLEEMRRSNESRLTEHVRAMCTSLDTISMYYRLDKNFGTRCHDYIPNYVTLFEPMRFQVRTVLEIGIGVVEHGQMSGVVPLGYSTGNSLRCWRDYFLYADVFGIDIYPSGIEKETRIKTFIADQSSASDLSKMMAEIGECDVIIDDGSHQFDHQIFTFMTLCPYLRQSGSIYVIEDVQERHDEMASLEAFPSSFQTYIRDHFDVKVFDNRVSRNRWDEFMIAFIRR